MPDCGSEIFTSTLGTISNNIADIWASVESKLPKTVGIAFGSCYTSCGSVGITEVAVGSFQVLDDPGNIQTSFTECGLTNLAILIVPFELTLDCTLALRATGIGHIWPTPDGDDGVVHLHALNVTGNILVSVPVHTNFEFSKVSVDLMFSGNWTSEPWPDTENILFNTVPLNELSIKYMHDFNKALRPSLSAKIRDAVQKADTPLDCTFPPLILAECNVTTRTASEYCSPCDTCCTCLMQQRCDGECSSCECVNCEDSKWYATMFLAAVFFLIISGILTWSFLN